MRKITEQASRAFVNNYNFKLDNTLVEVSPTETRMYLHTHCIARKANGKVTLSHQGWTTKTTKDRLNGILCTMRKPIIYQKAFVWYRDTPEQTEFKDGWNTI